MKWPTLFGKHRNQPASGRWHDWKQLIADDCEGRCIYCAIAEARFGGIRNFHIEHFRPKVRFPHLEDDIRNLYLACAICNVLKCDDWPADPVADHSLPAYPDPSAVDYNSIFDFTPTTHEVSSPTVAGTYVIGRMALNRAQLIIERRWIALQVQIEEFSAWIEASLNSLTPDELREAVQILNAISKTQSAAATARPYKDADTRRSTAKVPKKKRRAS